jgi:putative transposase
MEQQPTTDSIVFPSPEMSDLLTPILREGAQKMLATAIELEVHQWIKQRAELRDDHGRQLVVRNGHQPTRTIQTGVGNLEVRKPRVRDRRPPEGREPFMSKILPPYLRRTKAIEELLPWLYLKGISTGDFTEALQSLLGPDGAGLSATTITRLVRSWQDEHASWSQRSLAGTHYVYVWADGIYFNIRLEDDANKKQCILVLMGATPDGKKELIAVLDGYRESEQSWLELLNDVKRRGLALPPHVAVADGALGFWAAQRKAWPTTREQRCWVHKTANVLAKLPKSMQTKAKSRLHDIWQAETREAAVQAFDAFVEDFQAKYPKAVECLVKDRDALLIFYDFPAEHWIHLRTTNPIESTFATVRLRHRRTKGNGSRAACLAMVFKLAQSAEKHWRRLNGHQLIPDVIQGVRFINGIKNIAA